MTTAFASSPRFIEHRTGPHHPERPDRIRAVARAVRQAGLIDSPDPFPDFHLELAVRHQDQIKLRELEFAAADEMAALLVHPQSVIDRVRHICEIGGILDQSDTPVMAASFDVALLALGGVLRCCDAVMTDEVRRAFAAVRPPGHHAEPDRPMGFCLFSNIAIAAKHIQKTYGVERVAIVDFDVHHGNGTQAAFQADPSVLFISLHQHPDTCYPGSGYAWEAGVGPGRGFTLNIPMDPGSDDGNYYAAFDSKVLPRLDKFRPEVLLISAGFDAHRDDPLAGINLSDEAFGRMTEMLVDMAKVHCNGRIVSLLEGGYNLTALGHSVVRHLIALATS